MAGILIFGRGPERTAGAEDGAGQDLIVTTDSGRAKAFLEKEDCYLLLIDLSETGESGMELACFARGFPRHFLTPVVFLADDSRYEYRAFHEIHCYDYLKKPVDWNDVNHLLYLCGTRMETEKSAGRLLFRVGRRVCPVKTAGIVYMESANRCVLVHTLSETLSFPYLRLRDCLSQSRDIFLQCHRSTLINRSYIKRIDFTLHRIELAGCPEYLRIGKKYEDGLRREFDTKNGKGYNKMKN